LKKILGSGFEMIRISQCESPRVFRADVPQCTADCGIPFQPG
jgi:hypothetical protein